MEGWMMLFWRIGWCCFSVSCIPFLRILLEKKSLVMLGIMHLVHTQANISYPLLTTRMCTYQGVKNVSVFGKFCIHTKWKISSGYTIIPQVFFVDKPFQELRNSIRKNENFAVYVRGAVIVVNVQLCASFCMHLSVSLCFCVFQHVC